MSSVCLSRVRDGPISFALKLLVNVESMYFQLKMFFYSFSILCAIKTKNIQLEKKQYEKTPGTACVQKYFLAIVKFLWKGELKKILVRSLSFKITERIIIREKPIVSRAFFVRLFKL